MTDTPEDSGNLADDMAEYLQTFLDETEEQLDALVETMLALERDSANKDDLNEAFRLIHSIKGSAGMMGFDGITVLTHHLENRFERFRSGRARLDEATMNLVLRCIDFLRQCNNRLREGEQLGTSAELLGALKRLEEQPDAPPPTEPGPVAEQPPVTVEDVSEPEPGIAQEEPDEGEVLLRMVVRFRAGLQLVDLKARLIVTRLLKLGDVKRTRPDLDGLSDDESFEELEILIDTQEDVDCLRATADVDGVESIDFPGATSTPEETAEDQPAPVAASPDDPADELTTIATDAAPQVQSTEPPPLAPEELAPEADVLPSAVPETIAAELGPPPEAQPAPEHPVAETGTPEPAPMPAPPPPAGESGATEKSAAKVNETMRVDIDRLDNLMNLAGELVINRARFAQISGQISPALRKATMVNRVRDFGDGLRRTIEQLEAKGDTDGEWSAQIQQLRSGLELMIEQSDIWDNGRHCFNQIAEAIDQLSRVTHSLQRGVLETRMVPVGPLFNRFKRVVRDLAKERGKKVNLLIRGEKTELDKRMIDELGDPLVHLVRNAIDHGMELPEVRANRGKPETGTICLEASHSGNNVFIHVRDDGGGIRVDSVKAKLIANHVMSESAVDELSDPQALDYIWHPGFSTAKAVTDVSGRGVGMDVVKTRINQLNGTIDVETTPHEGTTFTLRLPLTLAIISSLLVRLKHVLFSMPIDDVREIVSIQQRDVVTVHGKQTFDVRGEFIPLVCIDNVFQWHGVDYGYRQPRGLAQMDEASGTIDLVMLHAGGKTIGLRVDALLGSQDVVIKSLSDNFISIRGLSGASILGDGTVCLMLDVGSLIDMATRPNRTVETEESAT